MAYMDVSPTSKFNGRTAAQIKGAKRVEIPTVGHLPHLEVSAQFYKVLLGFSG